MKDSMRRGSTPRGVAAVVRMGVAGRPGRGARRGSALIAGPRHASTDAQSDGFPFGINELAQLGLSGNVDHVSRCRLLRDSDADADASGVLDLLLVAPL